MPASFGGDWSRLRPVWSRQIEQFDPSISVVSDLSGLGGPIDYLWESDDGDGDGEGQVG